MLHKHHKLSHVCYMNLTKSLYKKTRPAGIRPPPPPQQHILTIRPSHIGRENHQTLAPLIHNDTVAHVRNNCNRTGP